MNTCDLIDVFIWDAANSNIYSSDSLDVPLGPRANLGPQRSHRLAHTCHIRPAGLAAHRPGHAGALDPNDLTQVRFGRFETARFGVGAGRGGGEERGVLIFGDGPRRGVQRLQLKLAGDLDVSASLLGARDGGGGKGRCRAH